VNQYSVFRSRPESLEVVSKFIFAVAADVRRRNLSQICCVRLVTSAATNKETASTDY
jgi:hypothetical protein